jgi:hypothetical protein
MSDSRPPRFSGEPREPAPATLALGDLIDGAARRIITAIVIAGGLIGLAIWSQEGGEAPRYQVTAADGRIIRINTESGTVIACDTERPGGRCAIVLQRGQSLDDALPARPAPPRVEARPAPALPAPAAAAANEAAAH